MLEQDELQQLSLERRLRIDTQLVPAIRFLGFASIALAVWLYNRWYRGQPDALSDALLFLGVTWVYAFLAWLALKRWHRPGRRFDLALTFLAVDMAFQVWAVYLTGGESSWLLPLLLLRTADQASTNSRRAFAFSHLMLVCVAGLYAWLALVEQRPIVWQQELVKIALLFMASLWIAYTAVQADRRRHTLKRVVEIGRDLIRQLAERSDELALERRRAEAASEAKSQFLANLSHEIRTPMNAILGLTDLALHSDDRVRTRSWLRTVQNSGRLLLRLLEDVLDFSRLENRQLRLEIEPCQLPAIAADISSLMTPQATAKGLQLKLVQRDEVPIVLADPVRLQQVLWNLASNAVKFADGGDIRIEIDGRPLDDGRFMARFVVSDDGPGISAKDQEKLFERFTQVDASSTRRHHGVGLGLAISSSLVELMAGRLEVDSQLGEGATFWFEVPLPVANDLGPAPSTSRTEPSAPPARWVDRHLLVVDDNQINAEVAAARLEDLGAQVAIASSGHEALEYLAAQPVDLVLLDCQMPIMDGYQTARQIRQRETVEGQDRVPIIALTANAMPGDRQRCLDAGMDDYLMKPLDRKLLNDMAARWLGDDR